MINIKALHEVVDKPYKYGELDCLQLLKMVYGEELPTEYKGVSIENYTEVFDEPSKAGEFLLEAIQHYFSPVKYPKIGDVVVVNTTHIIGIYAGNNMMITAFIDNGIKTIPIVFPVTYWRLS